VAGFQELEEDKLYRSLREYARVNAYLPINLRPVYGAEQQNIRSRVVVESALMVHPDMPEIEDEALSACLQIINSKLDTIIRMFAFPSNGPKELDFSRVNISAGGLSTYCDERYAEEDTLEIRLMLPTAPARVFYVYGKVVKCGPVGEKFELCVEFTEIESDIREQIAKYVFQKQREILRKNRSRRD
jgi:hypothetical protein